MGWNVPVPLDTHVPVVTPLPLSTIPAFRSAKVSGLSSQMRKSVKPMLTNGNLLMVRFSASEVAGQGPAGSLLVNVRVIVCPYSDAAGR